MITIKRDENGLYSARVRYKDAYGNVHQKRMNGYTRKKDLEDDYAKLIANSNQIVIVDKKDKQKTLFDVYEEWKQEYVNKVRFTTSYNRDSNFKLYTTQALGNRALTNIKKNELEAYVKNITKEDNKQSIRKFVNTLKQIFKFAENKYSIPNIAKSLESPYIEQLSSKETIKIIPPDVVKELVSNARLDYQVLYQTLYRTGVRIGEALALTWNDVDLEKQTISITKSLSNVGIQGSYKLGVGRTKNNSSIRTIGIDDFLVKCLKRYKTEFIETKDKYLWMGDTPFTPRVVRDQFTRSLKKIGIEEQFTLHAFRHTHASMLLSKGVPIPAVSHRLGHKNALITMSTYSHFIPSDEETIVNIIKDF